MLDVEGVAVIIRRSREPGRGPEARDRLVVGRRKRAVELLVKGLPPVHAIGLKLGVSNPTILGLA